LYKEQIGNHDNATKTPEAGSEEKRLWWWDIDYKQIPIYFGHHNSFDIPWKLSAKYRHNSNV